MYCHIVNFIFAAILLIPDLQFDNISSVYMTTITITSDMNRSE